MARSSSRPGSPKEIAGSESWARAKLHDSYERLEYSAPVGGSRSLRLPVYRSVQRTGPPVVLLHELPGITPALLLLAEHLLDRKFEVWIPSLIGTPGRRATWVQSLRVGVRVCMSREFHVLATGRPSPITDWLRALARHVSGPSSRRVGVIGLCMTGGFALAMALESPIAASAVGQPSLPLPFGRQRSRDVALTEEQIQALQARTDVRVFGFRYSHDMISPGARLDFLAEALGPKFDCRELNSGPGNPNRTSRFAHATVTNHLLAPDAPPHPGRPELEHLRDDVLAFLQRELTGLA